MDISNNIEQSTNILRVQWLGLRVGISEEGGLDDVINRVDEIPRGMFVSNGDTTLKEVQLIGFAVDERALSELDAHTRMKWRSWVAHMDEHRYQILDEDFNRIYIVD